MSKLDFFFETELTTAEKIKLVCSLALQFQVNYYKVSTSDGYYCSELLSSRLLTESIHQRILQSSYRVSVYFGVNNELNEDLSPQFIYNSSMNETNITSNNTLI